MRVEREETDVCWVFRFFVLVIVLVLYSANGGQATWRLACTRT
jgi:hypothetical protein